MDRYFAKEPPKFDFWSFVLSCLFYVFLCGVLLYAFLFGETRDQRIDTKTRPLVERIDRLERQVEELQSRMPIILDVNKALQGKKAIEVYKASKQQN
jgi:hypothetical protein